MQKCYNNKERIVSDKEGRTRRGPHDGNERRERERDVCGALGPFEVLSSNSIANSAWEREGEREEGPRRLFTHTVVVVVVVVVVVGV